MEKSVDQMNVGRSYPLWDSFLNEKLKKLQISTDVKQEVNIPEFHRKRVVGNGSWEKTRSWKVRHEIGNNEF